MIASLPMYARPEVNDVIAHFWSLIRKNLKDTGISAPETLSQGADMMTTWNDPTLVLSQTCGMPYRMFLHGKVQLVGMPVYDLDNCPPGHYRSAIVVRKDDPRSSFAEFQQARLAFNSEDSQSGTAAPLNYAAELGFTFDNRIQSFGHFKSAEMVVKDEACQRRSKSLPLAGARVHHLA